MLWRRVAGGKIPCYSVASKRALVSPKPRAAPSMPEAALPVGRCFAAERAWRGLILPKSGHVSMRRNQRKHQRSFADKINNISIKTIGRWRYTEKNFAAERLNYIVDSKRIELTDWCEMSKRATFRGDMSEMPRYIRSDPCRSITNTANMWAINRAVIAQKPWRDESTQKLKLATRRYWHAANASCDCCWQNQSACTKSFIS